MDGLSHGIGESHQMRDVVQAQQCESQELVAANEVVDVSAAMGRAGQARAAGIKGCVVMPESGIAQVPALSPHQCRAMAAKACGEHTIE